MLVRRKMDNVLKKKNTLWYINSGTRYNIYINEL